MNFQNLFRQQEQFDQFKDTLSAVGGSARGMFGEVGSKLNASLGGAPGQAMSDVNQGFSSVSRNLTSFIGVEQSDPETAAAAADLQDDSSNYSMCDELGYLNRILGFLMCFIAGMFLIFTSIFVFLPFLVIRPHKFALSFTLGNILSIVSSWFLVGPRAQLRAMFDPIRMWAAIVYLTSLVSTVLLVFIGGKFRYILVLVSAMVEVSALVWYSASYVPYARDGLRNLFVKCCGCSAGGYFD